MRIRRKQDKDEKGNREAEEKQENIQVKRRNNHTLRERGPIQVRKDEVGGEKKGAESLVVSGVVARLVSRSPPTTWKCTTSGGAPHRKAPFYLLGVATFWNLVLLLCCLYFCI